MKNKPKPKDQTRKQDKRETALPEEDEDSKLSSKNANLSSAEKKKKIISKSKKKMLSKLVSEKVNSPGKKSSRKSESQKLAELFGAVVTLSSPQPAIQDAEQMDTTLTDPASETSSIQTPSQKIPKDKRKDRKSKRKENKENGSHKNEIAAMSKSSKVWKDQLKIKAQRTSQTVMADVNMEQDGGRPDTMDRGRPGTIDEGRPGTIDGGRPGTMDGFCPPPGIVHESLMKEKKKTKKEKPDLDEDEEDKPKKEKAKRDKSKDFRTIFVGNLPIATDKKSLHKLFKKFGSIESVRLRCAPRSNTKLPKRAAVILKDFHPERDNICGYVCFKEEDGAKKALKMNGKLVGNFHLRVDMSNHNPKTDFKRSVFVGNLPLDIKEEDIRNHFDSSGKIRNVRVIRDSKSGVGKGICYVMFKSKDSVALAMKLKGTELCGRKVRVEYCLENPQKQKTVSQKQRMIKKDEKPKRKEDRLKKPKRNEDRNAKRKHIAHMRPSNLKSSAVFQTKIHAKQKKKKKRRHHRQ